ncbi:MAG: glycerophosphodiester phosphodiesterase [Actinobacteria bacterium]|nr:glycerophosphodiester phosphodiesterase [Actinomycetota bacterium]
MLNYAHQGGAKEGPSSTIHAMRAALAAGADAIELDVHATADRQLVVGHDATVDRTTEGAGAIATMTLAEVQALDNAYWWSPGSVVSTEGPWPLRGQGLRIPTLREVLETFPGVLLNLDIKQTAPTVEPYEDLLAELLREFGRADDVIVASFLDAATDAFSALASEVSTSAGTLATAEFYRAVREGREPAPMRHHALQVPAMVGDTVLVDRTFVDVAHDCGLAVHVWTIDEPDEMRRLVALGVDGVMTDVPSVLRQITPGFRG